MKAFLLITIAATVVSSQQTVDDLELDLLKERVTLMKQKLQLLENLKKSESYQNTLGTERFFVFVANSRRQFQSRQVSMLYSPLGIIKVQMDSRSEILIIRPQRLVQVSRLARVFGFLIPEGIWKLSAQVGVELPKASYTQPLPNQHLINSLTPLLPLQQDLLSTEHAIMKSIFDVKRSRVLFEASKAQAELANTKLLSYRSRHVVKNASVVAYELMNQKGLRYQNYQSQSRLQSQIVVIAMSNGEVVMRAPYEDGLNIVLARYQSGYEQIVDTNYYMQICLTIYVDIVGPHNVNEESFIGVLNADGRLNIAIGEIRQPEDQSLIRWESRLLIRSMKDSKMKVSNKRSDPLYLVTNAKQRDSCPHQLYLFKINCVRNRDSCRDQNQGLVQTLIHSVPRVSH